MRGIGVVRGVNGVRVGDRDGLIDFRWFGGGYSGGVRGYREGLARGHGGLNFLFSALQSPQLS